MLLHHAYQKKLMERLSNSREEYWSQIKKELSGTNDSGGFRFQYIEIGQLLSHGFSVTLTDKQPQVLVVRTWNATYDNGRFDQGIFNLDRLAITNRTVPLSLQESDTVNRLLNTEIELKNRVGVVLDGLFCQLEHNGRKLDWNTDEEMNDNLTELVELVRNKAAYFTE